MDLVHERAAGLDISKSVAKVAIRTPGKRAGTFPIVVTTWGATTNQILALRDMPLAAKVTTVLMEATSDYWKPFYYLFEDVLPVMLVNAKAARNIPGRKTDTWGIHLRRASTGPARLRLALTDPVLHGSFTHGSGLPAASLASADGPFRPTP